MTRQTLILGLLSMLMVGGSCGSSCVNFDGQTVRMHIDEEQDRLDMLLLYRGIHSSSANTTGAIEQVEEILNGARWFALISNFPLMFHVDKMADSECDPEQPAANHLKDLVDENVEVRNGDLWQDPSNKLNAWQLVRVRNLSAIVAAANTVIVEGVRKADSEGKLLKGTWLHDEASVALFREAADRRDVFIAFEGQALTFMLPVSDVGWATIKRELLGILRKGLDVHGTGSIADEKAERRSSALIEFLSISEWSIEREPDRVLFVLGSRHADELRLEFPTVGLEQTDLADDLRGRGWPIAIDGNDDAAHRAYEALLREN